MLFLDSALPMNHTFPIVFDVMSVTLYKTYIGNRQDYPISFSLSLLCIIGLLCLMYDFGFII